MHFLRRLLYMMLVIVGVSMFMFVLVRVIPGDPIAKALGPGADAASIKKMRDQMGLDQPIYVQYSRYIEGITRGELGMSLVEYRDTADIIRDKFPATLELILASMTLAVILAIPLGVFSALKRNSLTDHFNTLISLIGVSFPQFWTGLMIQLLFGYILAFLPLTGRISGSSTHFHLGVFFNRQPAYAQLCRFLGCPAASGRTHFRSVPCPPGQYHPAHPGKHDR